MWYGDLLPEAKQPCHKAGMVGLNGEVVVAGRRFDASSKDPSRKNVARVGNHMVTFIIRKPLG